LRERAAEWRDPGLFHLDDVQGAGEATTERRDNEIADLKKKALNPAPQEARPVEQTGDK